MLVAALWEYSAYLVSERMVLCYDDRKELGTLEVNLSLVIVFMFIYSGKFNFPRLNSCDLSFEAFNIVHFLVQYNSNLSLDVRDSVGEAKVTRNSNFSSFSFRFYEDFNFYSSNQTKMDSVTVT